jgi:predicted nucleotide-binding protein
MKYWIVKSIHQSKDDFEGRVGTTDEWFANNAPKDFLVNDRVFYWLMAPASKLVALGSVKKVYPPKSKRNRETLFDVKRLTPVFSRPLLKRELLKDQIISQASFLKRGPVGTIYRLSNEEGEALFRAVASQNPEHRGLWADIALTEPQLNTVPHERPVVPVQDSTNIPYIFIGHGRNPLWLAVKSFLEECGLKTIYFESESRVSESVIPVLEKMVEKASFAVIVLTGEDQTKEGRLRARQNVIHETGLAQGKLGFKKVVILRQEDVEEFTNLAGLQDIPFTNRIEQSFYDLGRVLKREGLV